MSECSRLRGHEGYAACDDVFHVKHRRCNLHILRFRLATKAHSFQCGSSPQQSLRLCRGPQRYLLFFSITSSARER